MNAIPCSNNENEMEQWDTIGIGSNVNKGGSLNESWVGTTYFFPTSCKDPKAAMATIKRDKSGAKRKLERKVFRIWTNFSKPTLHAKACDYFHI